MRQFRQPKAQGQQHGEETAPAVSLASQYGYSAETDEEPHGETQSKTEGQQPKTEGQQGKETAPAVTLAGQYGYSAETDGETRGESIRLAYQAKSFSYFRTSTLTERATARRGFRR